MGHFFDIDGKFFQIMTKAGNLLLLNLLFLLCCLPVVTIGASLTAMYSVTLKMAKGEESYIARSFFRAFRDNFRQATLLWLVVLFVALALLADHWFANRMMEAVNNGTASDPQLFATVSGVLSVFSKVMLFIWAAISAYIFPIAAKFENTMKNILKNALIIVNHPLYQNSGNGGNKLVDFGYRVYGPAIRNDGPDGVFVYRLFADGFCKFLFVERRV